MRQHSDFGVVLDSLAVEERQGVQKQSAIYHDIRERSAVIQVKSVNLTKSVMWDWMHLICENICPNMFKLWSGQFKGLNSRHFDYVIQEKVWI